MDINYEKLWEFVIDARPHKDPYTLHGPDHWLRVERNACILTTRTGALIHVVRLFALFHDSQRFSDGTDSGHGGRGADFAAELRGDLFDISDDDFELLHFACKNHTVGYHHDDPTVGTCWDADRLDLGRVGAIPDASFMSTDFGREMADFGTTKPWIDLASQFIESPLTHHHKWQ